MPNDLSHLASFSTELGTTTLPQAGYGVPLLAGFHTVFPELVRQYTGDPGSILSSMLTDGFVAGDALYRMATRLLQQTAAPRTIKIGRLQTALDQSLLLTPLNLVEGSVYTLTFTNSQGSETATATGDATATAAEIATALDVAISAFTVCTQLASTDNTGSLTVDVTTAGQSFAMDWTVNSARRPADLTLLDGSTDGALATDLAAIESEDSDWYGLLLDQDSVALSTIAQTFVSTRRKLLFTETSDSNATASGTSTDVGSVATTGLQDRVAPVFSPSYRRYEAAALAGKILPENPGSVTWANKQLIGAAAAKLTGAEYAVLQTKNFTVLRALNATQSATQGGNVGGANGFIDITRSFDWVDSRLEERIAELLLSNGKIPFTLAGLSMVRQTCERVIDEAVSQGVLSAGDPDNPLDPIPQVILPRIGEAGADATARGLRVLSEVKITGRFGGAIHGVVGTVRLGL